jgi:hypothetical protein
MSNEIHILTDVLSDFNYNLNGRIYPKSTMEKAIEDYNIKIRIKQRKEKLEKINKTSNN